MSLACIGEQPGWRARRELTESGETASIGGRIPAKLFVTCAKWMRVVPGFLIGARRTIGAGGRDSIYGCCWRGRLGGTTMA